VSGLSVDPVPAIVHTIRLDNAVFEGDNVVYLLDPPAGPTTLIDAGVATQPVRDGLEAGFDDAGVAIEDLDRILLTHWHSDHAGLAGDLQADSGAEVYVHEADAPLVDGSGFDAWQDERSRFFERWGIPPEPLAELIDFLGKPDALAGVDADVTTFTHGERFPLGPGSGPDGDADALRAIHLPGHADGHAIYAYERRAEAFVGDVILPKYTPNVGGADPRVDRPLPTYRSSLRWLAGTDLDRAWPGHRDPIDDPAGRAEEILTHHDERTERTRDALAAVGPATPWEVGAELFGDLENIHIMHGPGEAWAHLEALAETEGIERREADGVLEYEYVA
jgi:glyoxylase-like metal-dependent hydrolase (beta-lactamase superfamily II)